LLFLASSDDDAFSLVYECECECDRREEDDDDDDDEDEDYEDEDEDEENIRAKDSTCGCTHHGHHWDRSRAVYRHSLRDLVQTHLISTFKTNPSLLLHQALLSISPERESTRQLLEDEILPSIATSCADTVCSALDIHAHNRNVKEIMALLDSSSYLLRPRDHPSLAAAVLTLSLSPSDIVRARSLEILEKELKDTMSAIRVALVGSFAFVHEQTNKDELERVLKLGLGSSARQDRIRRWADAVSTPGTNAPNPLAFAALVMGLPMLPLGGGGGLVGGGGGPVGGGVGPAGVAVNAAAVGAMNDDADDVDPFGYFDVDRTDPDLEDLREEYRPKLRERMEAWLEVAGEMKRGGYGVLVRFYEDVVEDMPFLIAGDVVEELIGRCGVDFLVLGFLVLMVFFSLVARLADRPSKHHLCDALDSLSEFVKKQRRRMATRSDRMKKHRHGPASGGGGGGGPSGSGWGELFANGNRGMFTFGSGLGGESASGESSSTSMGGGMDDVD
jgi:hypothetical protein